MTTAEIKMPALDGTTALGFLAALGVLDVLHRAGRDPVMYWKDSFAPAPIIQGISDIDELVEMIDRDRMRWRDGCLLDGRTSRRFDDLKIEPVEHREWAGEIFDNIAETRAYSDLFCALMSENALDAKGENSKPTHLDFTTANQRFLKMVRELATEVDGERIREAILGPWRQDSPLPSLRWSPHTERLYALRAIRPTKDKPLGVPGADWLALLGLAFFPTCSIQRAGEQKFSLKTSACDQQWKVSAIRWPLWSVPLERDTVWSLVGDAGVVGERHQPTPAHLLALGVRQVMEAPIRRSDRGGYGSFGGASVLVKGG